MAINLELEIKVIRKFAEKSKQERLIQFVSNPKHRNKFTNDLFHSNHLNWNLFSEVKGIEENIILDALLKNKISETKCYLISESSELDTKTLELSEALRKVVGWGMETILVFGDGEIIFYEGEWKSRYISKYVN